MTVEDVNEILMAVDVAGDGVKKTLWAQSFTENGFFKQGDATRMALRNGGWSRTGGCGYRAPSERRARPISNIAGKGTRALAFIDEYNRLRVTVDTEDTFRSSTQVGGGLSKLGVERQIERGGRTYIYSPEPMPLSVDLDGDGIEEIIVPQNQIPGRWRHHLQGAGRLSFPDGQLGLRGHGDGARRHHGGRNPGARRRGRALYELSEYPG